MCYRSRCPKERFSQKLEGQKEWSVLTSINETNNDIDLVLCGKASNLHGFFPQKTHEIPRMSGVQASFQIGKNRNDSRHLCQFAILLTTKPWIYSNYNSLKWIGELTRNLESLKVSQLGCKGSETMSVTVNVRFLSLLYAVQHHWCKSEISKHSQSINQEMVLIWMKK